MRIDPFFYQQPPRGFIDELSAPLHTQKPLGFDKHRQAGKDEVAATGLFLQSRFPQGEALLEAAYRDFAAFLRVTDVGGDRFPLRLLRGQVCGKESFRLSVQKDGVTVLAEEPEGVRRALVCIEEEMTRREGPLLPLGDTVRRPYVKTRMTRGFFSPTNRAPKFGDELLDDVDYYPDEYLNRLAHNGTNALWIYTSLRALIASPLFSDDREAAARRVQKLLRVTERCARYGVRVFLFAIEPYGLTAEEALLHPELLGGAPVRGLHPVCLRSPAARDHVIGAIEALFRTVPLLGGLISITAGERTTTCPSVATYQSCPRCSQYSRGENLAFCVDVLKEGLRRAGTGAEFISWTYSHRYWEEADVREYVQRIPTDVRLMQNFEDGGFNLQLGRERVAWDYWLSYVGPCKNFTVTAEEAARRGCEMWAKMQICSSHELATVPYVPVPGILYDKYRAARELGTTGIMECWYFGNYPSLMSRASSALAFWDRFDGKEAFLRDLAARLYGRSRAEGVVRAWTEFERAYKNYPTNVMFNYYGPMHDGVVWQLQLLPKNTPLPRSWHLTDPPDGDRIGECLFRGHTLNEAVTLAEEIVTHWQAGLAALPLSPEDELSSAAHALGVLFASGLNVLRFYRLRARLGKGEDDAHALLDGLAAIVREEIAHSREMIALCHADPRLGYHSEAEGFKFFPEKLEARCAQLSRLLAEEFPVVAARIDQGLPPLGYYYAQGHTAYRLGTGEIALDGERSFCVEQTPTGICTTVTCPCGDDVTLDYEFDLFMPECGIIVSERPIAVHEESTACYPPGIGLAPAATSHQALFGERIAEELARHRLERTPLQNGRVLYRVYTAVANEQWDRKTAIKLRITVGGVKWIASPDPLSTLGRNSDVADEYGFLIP